jgi:hypothetical protein
MQILSWLTQNQEWFFSGAGVVLITAVGWLIKRVLKDNSSIQHQSSGQNSINIQASRDINLTSASINNDD